MHIAFNISVLFFASFALSPKLTAAVETTRQKEKVRYSFKVDIPKDKKPVPSKDEQDYITLCLASAFNEIHDPNNYTIEEIDIEDKLITPIPSAELSRENLYDDYYDDDGYDDDSYEDDNWDDDSGWGPLLSYLTWYIGYYTDVWAATCNLCPPFMLSSYHNSHEWEHSFNKCLRESSFRDIKKAYNVRIDVLDNEEHFEDIQSEIKVSFLIPVDGLTDEEHNLVMETLKDTYNVLEQKGNNQSAIHSTSFKKSTSFPVGGDGKKKQAVASSNLRSNPSGWLIHITGTVGSMNGSEFSSMPPLDVTSIVDWENALCDKLSAGPFENYGTISGCKIETDTLPHALMMTYE